MIRKETILILEGKDRQETDELDGGMPLSVGDVVHVHRKIGSIDYVVSEKKIDCYIPDGSDQRVRIEYRLRQMDG